MKVRELISILRKANPNANVVFAYTEEIPGHDSFANDYLSCDEEIESARIKDEQVVLCGISALSSPCGHNLLGDED